MSISIEHIKDFLSKKNRKCDFICRVETENHIYDYKYTQELNDGEYMLLLQKCIDSNGCYFVNNLATDHVELFLKLMTSARLALPEQHINSRWEIVMEEIMNDSKVLLSSCKDNSYCDKALTVEKDVFVPPSVVSMREEELINPVADRVANNKKIFGKKNIKSDLYNESWQKDLMIEDYRNDLGSKLYTYCSRHKIKRLIDILDIDESIVVNQYGIGPKFLHELKSAKEWIPTLSPQGEEINLFPSGQFKNQPISKVRITGTIKNKLPVKVQNFCSLKHITNLIDILDIKEEDINNTDGYGKSAIVDFETVKDWIKHNQTEILEIYDTFDHKHVFPELTEEQCNIPLVDRLEVAINQFMDYCKKREDVETICVLDFAILNPISPDEIENEYQKCILNGQKITKKQVENYLRNQRRIAYGLHELTSEGNRLKVQMLKDTIIHGGRYEKTNLSFSKSLGQELQSYKQNVVFMPIDEFCSDMGVDNINDPKCTLMLNALHMKLSTVNNDYSRDQYYVIPTENDGSASRLAEYNEMIIRAIGNSQGKATTSYQEVRPRSFEKIKDYLSEEYPEKELDEIFLEKCLENHSWVESILEGCETKFQIKYKYLITATDRFARLIYENRDKVLNKNVMPELDKEKDPSLNKHVEFQNFCGKEKKQGHTHKVCKKYSWVGTIGDGDYCYAPDGILISPSPKVEIYKFIESKKEELFNFVDVKKFLELKGYPKRSDWVIRSYIKSRCYEDANAPYTYCNKKYAECHTDIVWMNEPTVEPSPLYQIDIKNRVIDLLKNSNDNTCLLSYLMHSCEELLKPYTSNTIFYKIIDKMVDVNMIEKTIVDGKTLITIKKDELIQIQESTINEYEIEDIEKVGTSENVFDTIETTEQNIPQVPGWSSLLEEMKLQLKSYKYYIEDEFDFNYCLTKLVTFIDEDLEDKELKTNLTNGIVHLWYTKNDSFDLHNILTTVIFSFEGLLRQIYKNLYSREMDYTNGLRDVVSQISEMNDWQKKNWDNGQYHPIRMYKKLYRTRNRIAHSEPLYFSQQEYMSTINMFLVLYAYAVCKFNV